MARGALGGGVGPLSGAALGAIIGLTLSAGALPPMLAGLVIGYALGEWIEAISSGPFRGRRARADRIRDALVGALALVLGLAALLGVGRPARWLGLVGGALLVLIGLRLLLRRL
jgi:hypothetical protein